MAERRVCGFESRDYWDDKSGCRANSNVLVNSCCPGYVKTDMTGGGGPKTPDQGAQTPVMLVLEDLGGRSGGFWQHEQEIEW